MHYVINKITDKYEINKWINSREYEDWKYNFEMPFNNELVMQVIEGDENFDTKCNLICETLNNQINLYKVFYGDSEDREYYFPKVLYTWSKL